MRIGTAHLFQDAVGCRLHRKIQMTDRALADKRHHLIKITEQVADIQIVERYAQFRVDPAKAADQMRQTCSNVSPIFPQAICHQDNIFRAGHLNHLATSLDQLVLGNAAIPGKHQTLGTTPAVAAGIEEKRWSLERVVEMTEAYWKPKYEAKREEKAIFKRLAEDEIFQKALVAEEQSG